MAKRKNMTAAEAIALVNAAEFSAREVVAIQEACTKTLIDDLPDPLGMARSLIAAARDLNQTALSLFSRADLQRTRQEIERMQIAKADAEDRAQDKA